MLPLFVTPDKMVRESEQLPLILLNIGNDVLYLSLGRIGEKISISLLIKIVPTLLSQLYDSITEPAERLGQAAVIFGIVELIAFFYQIVDQFEFLVQF